MNSGVSVIKCICFYFREMHMNEITELNAYTKGQTTWTIFSRDQ